MVLVMGVLICPSTAEAKKDTGIRVYNGGWSADEFPSVVITSPRDRKNNNYYLGTVFGAGENYKVTSSKPSVGKVKKYSSEQFFFYPKKAGKTQIKITGVVKGKKRTWKKVVKVVKFSQPFQSLKIDGKSYQKKVKGRYAYIGYNSEKSKAKLTYKLKKGWKVKGVYSDDLCLQRLKTKKSYTIRKEEGYRYNTIYLVLKHKKTGAEIEVNVYYKR